MGLTQQLPMTTHRALLLPAPAKINLFLRILQKRSDGYHHLQTVFQFLDWSDQLHFSLRADKQIYLHCALPQIRDADNLIMRAARLLQQVTGCTAGCDIVCEKNIPLGSGLGGGSSDAATTLWALNVLWQCGLDLPTLSMLGLQLGADVPIFIHGHAAWAEGIGEQFTPMDLPTAWAVILNPQVPVSTAAIFQHPALVRDQKPYPIGQMPLQHENDCSALVCQLYPEIGQALAWLSRHNTAWLTGTGCAIVSAFETRAAAEELAAQIPAPWSGSVAQTCNTSPLLTALNAL